MSNKYTLAEVAKHNDTKSLWIVVDKKVYDVTKYMKEHPGGPAILKGVAGKECSKEFYASHLPTVSNVK